MNTLNQILAAAPALAPVLVSFFMVASATCTLASVLDAVLPQPKPGSHWIPLRKLISIAALNIGNAANSKAPYLASWLLQATFASLKSVPKANLVYTLGLKTADVLQAVEQAEAANPAIIKAIVGPLLESATDTPEPAPPVAVAVVAVNPAPPAIPATA